MAKGKKNEDGNANNNNKNEQTIILKVYLHCQECVKPVIKYLEALEGVEEVNTNFEDHNLTIKSKKDIDPRNLAHKLEKKFNKQVEIISPKLKPQSAPKEVKKEEPKIVQVTLNIYIHCQNCGNSIKQRIQKMTGVQTVEVDAEKSQVVVKGEIEALKLVEYIDKRMGKQATIHKTQNLTKENRKRDSDNNNNNNSNNNNNNNNNNNRRFIENGAFNFNAQNYIPQPQHMEFLYSSEMFNDENSQACIVM